MSPQSLAALLAFAVNVSLVIIIILDDVRSRTNRLFALVVCCFALWNVADIVLVNSTTPEGASLGGALMSAALLFAPAFLLLMSFDFPRPVSSRWDSGVVRGVLLAVPFAFALLAGLNLFTPVVLEKVAGDASPRYITSTPGGIIGGLMFGCIFVYLGWGMVNFTVQLRRARSGEERRRVMPLLLGTGAAALLIAIHEIFRAYDPHGYAYRVLSLLVSLFFAFVILGNRLIVLRRIGRQGVAYSLVTGLFFAFYIVVITHLADLLAVSLGGSRETMVIVLIVLLAVSFRPLVVRVDAVVERVLSRNIFRYRQQFNQFTQETFQISGLAELESAVRAFLRESIGASRVDLMIRDAVSGKACSAGDPARCLSAETLASLGGVTDHRIVEIEEVLHISAAGDRAILAEAAGGFIVPLPSERGLAGVLLVGPTLSGRSFTLDEMDFLSIVAGGLSLAVERNSLVERIRSEELRAAKMEKLASLGRLTAGIAHEFRNPLNIISTSAQTILRHPGDLELHKETGRYILEEAGRLGRTVDEFLQFAKPHTPVWERVNIAETIDRAIQSLQGPALASRVKIAKQCDPAVPEIITSPQHIERVLSNLGLNAIEAMPGGGVLAFALTPANSEAVVLSVSDTGPGIPARHHATLFDPFFTTKPNGTGLGLAIVYMLMQSVRGRISFTSTSAGTTFHLELPIDGSRL